MKRFVVALNVLILFGLVSCIHESGRRSKMPYEPDHRIPIKVPDGEDNMSENWSRLDSGKYLRSLQRDVNTRIDNGPRGPDTITGKCCIYVHYILDSGFSIISQSSLRLLS